MGVPGSPVRLLAGALHAFLYSSGRMHDLTATYGVGDVHAINDHGNISGQAADGRAMVITNGTVDAFGPPGSTAGAINDKGQILATSCDRAGVFCYETLRLDAVPAVPQPPAAMTLLAGLAVLLARRGRRKEPG